MKQKNIFKLMSWLIMLNGLLMLIIHAGWWIAAGVGIIIVGNNLEQNIINKHIEFDGN